LSKEYSSPFPTAEDTHMKKMHKKRLARTKSYVKFGIRAIADTDTTCQSSAKLAVPLINTEHKVRNCR